MISRRTFGTKVHMQFLRHKTQRVCYVMPYSRVMEDGRKLAWSERPRELVNLTRTDVERKYKNQNFNDSSHSRIGLKRVLADNSRKRPCSTMQLATARLQGNSRS